MTLCHRIHVATCAAVLGVGAIAASVGAATSVATYQFNDTLDADELGPPSLLAVDPLSQASFTDDIVFGVNRRVYEFGGNAFPASEQGGLSLDTTGLVAGNDYSVELVFKFFDGDSQYRRILDVEDRQADNGFYVAPSNNLSIYENADFTGTHSYVNDAYHHVVLTVSGGTANAYLDGQFDLTLGTNIMDINNLDDLLHFFVDNTGGSFNNEYSGGRVALIRLYDGELTAGEVADLASQAGVPEPASIALLAGGAGMLLAARRR